MKVLVTGANGQLGTDIIKALQNIPHLGIDINDCDITDKYQTEKIITKYNPTAVIHCAAYTNVEKAETEPDICHNINVNGTANIAHACRLIGAKMLYISTDYVFSSEGQKAGSDNFHKATGIPHPINVYGQTKYEGELAVQELLDSFFIVRISWVFGKHGNNFVKTMLNLAKTKTEISVIKDQIGSPTYTADLAPLLINMAESKKYGIYHATNEGECSWAEFAQEIFRQQGLNTKVNPILSSEYATRAKRPKNSRLDKSSLSEAGFKRLPTWQNALERMLTNE